MSSGTEYDEKFASRFSAEDAEFQRYRERTPDPPPVLEDWRAARGRRDRRFPEQLQHEPRGHQQQHHHHHHHHHHHQPDRRWSDRNSGSYGQRSRY